MHGPRGQAPGGEGRRIVAGLLSMLLPGTGQMYRGAWARGALLLGLFVVAAVAVALAAARPVGTASWLLEATCCSGGWARTPSCCCSACSRPSTLGGRP